MDPKLAEIYGTNQPSEADIEKLAAAELAEGLSENDEANIDGMSDDEVEALAAQVLADAQGSDEEQPQYEEQEEEQDGNDPEAMEKISEADYLGRVMAHSYVQELRNIDALMEKEAADAAAAAKPGLGARALEGAKQVGGRALFGLGALGEKASRGKLTGGKAMGLGGALAAGGLAAGGYGAKKLLGKKKESSVGESAKKGFEAVKGAVKGRPAAYKDAGRMVREAVTGKGSMGTGSMTKMDRLRALGGAAKKVAPEGAALTAAGGAAAAYKHKSKKSSALDTLAEQRALEILAENGIDPNAEVEIEKVSDGEQEVLAQAVEQRAFEMLQEAGYVSDEQVEQEESEGSEE